MDFVQVKNMRRATQLEHHVVRDVHQYLHTALATTRQAVHHPLRGGGFGVDVAHHTARETATQVGGADLDGHAVGILHGDSRKAGLQQRCTRECSNFTCHAVHTQAMRQIGREFEREQRVIQRQVFADVLAQGCIGSQLHQAAVVFGQLEFTRRAQHALAFHAAQLAHLDQERFAVFARWQFGTDQCAGHTDADPRVRCAANNVQQLGLADIHCADTQAVSVRVLFSRLDFAHHDVGERWRNRLELFHLQTRHGQGFGQLFSAQVRVAEFAQPGFRKLHVRYS